MDEALNELGAYLADRLGPALLASQVALGELTIEVDRGAIVPTLEFLRDDPRCRFGCLIDICGVDYPEREQRFDVVYHLLSPWQNHRIRVSVKTDEATPVPSASRSSRRPTGSSARPTISTASCSRATRICAASSPTTVQASLRKDFPLTGFVELRYDDELKRVSTSR